MKSSVQEVNVKTKSYKIMLLGIAVVLLGIGDGINWHGLIGFIIVIIGFFLKDEA